MKHTLVIGTDFKRSSLKMRERVHMDDSMKPEIMGRIKGIKGISECVILTTCNRVEIYLVSINPSASKDGVITLLSEFHGLQRNIIEQMMYIYQCSEAARHLFRVAAGLSSMVIGETEVLGQVKRAYLLAKNSGGSGPILNKLFQTAISLGRQARRETTVNEGITSLGSAAAKLAVRLADPKQATISVIGCGTIGSTVAKNLIKHGARKLYLSNRTVDEAIKLSEKTGGLVMPFNRLDDLVAHSDLIISAASSDSHIFTKERLMNAMKNRSKLIIIDIAVPRNVDPEAESIDNLEIHTLEGLKETVNANIRIRESSIATVNELIENKLGFYTKWYLKRAMYEKETACGKPGINARNPTGLYRQRASEVDRSRGDRHH